jgi:GDP-L-fucose synthase
LAILVKEIVGLEGEILIDKTKPDGTPRKFMDVSKLNSLGWKVKITLEEGVQKVYQEIKNNNWN